MRIGLFGAPIGNENLGCVALTYSILAVLETVAMRYDERFEYLIFDWSRSIEKEKIMSNNLNIEPARIKFCKLTLISDPLRNIKNALGIREMKREIETCDCIIDLTEGDSFSDIYGDHMFYGRTNIKCMIEKMGIPLMLGPQTYGPYMSKRSREMAMKAIGGADIVLTRDLTSLEIIKSMVEREVIYTTDLAFMLPFNKNAVIENSDRIKIGINASSLLGMEMQEVHAKKFKIQTDYLAYMRKVISELLKMNLYEIHMIPHVKKDHELHLILKKEFPKLIVEEPFEDPISAKTLISQMDIFIGARMHGAIAAFTTGVACIPTAYSRKFAGLFESVGYNYLVDLQMLTTIEAVNKTLNYVLQYKTLSSSSILCKEKYQKHTDLIFKTIDDWLMEVQNRTALNVLGNKKGKAHKS